MKERFRTQKWSWRLVGLAALAAPLMAPARGSAADQVILGKKLIVKGPASGNNSVIVMAKEPASPNTVVGDPTVGGAALTVVANGGTPTQQIFTLPAANWSAIGSGFKYTDPTAAAGPVKVAFLKKTGGGTFLIKAVIKGSSITVAPPNPGTDGGAILDITGGDRYCTSDGGAAGGTLSNSPTVFKVLNPTAEAGCPTGPTTTSTTTSSTTTTSTTTTTVPAGCGNHIIEGSEQCDDGNLVPGDGCRADCTLEVCGDGILDPQEQCDDSNNTPGDGCNATCETEASTCAPRIGGRTVTVSINTPQPLAGIRLDLEYPQVHTSIPGAGNSSIVRSHITVFPSGGQFVANDTETDLIFLLAGSTDFIPSGPVYSVDFDECTPLSANMCNRNQNVINCCDNPSDPAQFPNTCTAFTPAITCTKDADCPPQINAICSGGGTPYPCCTGPGTGTCTGTAGNCTFRCPANPPLCAIGHFPTSSIGECDNVDGACPGDNVCVTQASSTGCTVSDPVDFQGLPVDGVTCSVSIMSGP